MTRRIGDARATAHALAAHCDAIAGPDDAERRAAEAGEIIRLAARVRDRGVMLLGLRLRVVALLEQGDILGAEADMTAFSRVADDLGQPGYSFYVPLWQGFRAHARGDLAEMESCIAEVRRLGERAGSRNAAVLAFVMEGWLSVERLTAHDSTPRMLQALGIVPELAPDGGGWLALYPGQPAGVRRAFLPRLEQMLATLPPDAEWTSALCWSAMSLIEAGEPDEAPYAARGPPVPAAARAPVRDRRHRGRLARVHPALPRRSRRDDGRPRPGRRALRRGARGQPAWRRTVGGGAHPGGLGGHARPPGRARRRRPRG